MRSLNLRQIKLRAGEEYRDEIELELEPFELGGERYLPVPDKVPAELAITKASTGTVLELGFTARLHGPCYRCLGDAVLEVPISAREYQANNPEGEEELRTPYLTDDSLDLTAWSRDTVALALPDKILCRAECAGIGTTSSPRERTHASASCAGVQAFSAANSWTRSASCRFRSKFSPCIRGWFRLKSSSVNSSGDEKRPARKPRPSGL